LVNFPDPRKSPILGKTGPSRKNESPER
jgi:ArsR family transcriptional regulator